MCVFCIYIFLHINNLFLCILSSLYIFSFMCFCVVSQFIPHCFLKRQNIENYLNNVIVI